MTQILANNRQAVRSSRFKDKAQVCGRSAEIVGKREEVWEYMAVWQVPPPLHPHISKPQHRS